MRRNGLQLAHAISAPAITLNNSAARKIVEPLHYDIIGHRLRTVSLPALGRAQEQVFDVTVCNDQFIGDNAVHCSTRAVIRQMLRVGGAVHVLTAPRAKWEKKSRITG